MRRVTAAARAGCPSPPVATSRRSARRGSFPHSAGVGLLCGSALLFTPAAARADQAGDIAAARQLGQDGVLLADQGKCALAVEKLERAEKLHHAPTTAVRLAECEIELGKIVVATERLQRLVRETLAPSAPTVFKEAMARAEKILNAAVPKIAVLRITVRAPSGVKVAVTVDDEPLSPALIDADRPTDPGTHRVQATGKGLIPVTTRVTLKDGERNNLALNLQLDPNPPPDAPTDVNDEPTKKNGSSDGAKTLGYVALGVGAAGLVFGAVSGAIVASKTSSLDLVCSDKSCPRSEQDNIDSAKTWATISTVSFAVGGAAVVGGVILLLTGGSGKASTSTGSNRRAVGPTLGVGYLGLDGRF